MSAGVCDLDMRISQVGRTGIEKILKALGVCLVHVSVTSEHPYFIAEPLCC